VLAGALAEHDQVGERVATQTVRAVQPRRTLSRREQPRHRRHLGVTVDADAAHDVVGGRPDLHRHRGDVDVGELLELVVHRRELLLDVLRAVRHARLDPGDVEEHAAVRAPAALADLLHDLARDVIAGEELGRPPRVLVPLGVLPPLLFGVGRLAFVVVGDVVEHEALAVLVAQDAAFAAHPLGHQDPLDRRRPDHPRRVELDELHVHQIGARVEGERVAVAGVLPAVAGDLERATDAAGGEDDGLGLEDPQVALLAIVAERAGDPPGVDEQLDDRVLHVDLEPLVDAVVLQGPDHLEARSIADVGEPRVAVAAEVALEDAPVLGAIEDRAPGLELAHPFGRLLGVQLRHPPVVEVLAAAHGVGEVDLPAVAVVDVRHRRGHPALGHDRVRLAEQRLADEPDGEAGGGGLDRRPQAGAAGADDDDVVLVGLDVGSHF
jgi:hypothetical protein